MSSGCIADTEAASTSKSNEIASSTPDAMHPILLDSAAVRADSLSVPHPKATCAVDTADTDPTADITNVAAAAAAESFAQETSIPDAGNVSNVLVVAHEPANGVAPNSGGTLLAGQQLSTPTPTPTATPTKEPLSTDNTSALVDQDMVSAHKNPNPEVEDAAAHNYDHDHDEDEIASDIQERSQFSDVGSNVSETGDGDGAEPIDDKVPETGLVATRSDPLTTNCNKEGVNDAILAAGHIVSACGAPGKTSSGNEGDGTSNVSAVNTEMPSLAMSNVNVALAPGQVHLNDSLPGIQEEHESEPEEESSEPAASYTSPNHEWARILQRRLGKGLNDAQMLARSNSMLASPSILAQALTQVIPSLQVKEASAVSPGSSGREYQTAEELFDRPATIAPSMPAYHYEDQPSKDDAFPSSSFANNSQAQFLLFAPLNPDQLGKASSSSQPTAPPPPVDNPSLTKQSQPAAVPLPAQSQPQPQPQQQQQPPTLLTSVPQPAPVAPPSIPITIPPIAVAPSPASRAHGLSPTGIEARQSPLVSREPPAASRNIRHSLMQHSSSGHEERPGLNSHGTSNSRTLLNQGSSSSLTATPVSSAPRDQQSGSALNYPAPIQYTPVTQYKANPSKEGSRSNKKPRDTIAAAKEPVTLVESPKDIKVLADTKEPAGENLAAGPAPTASTATTSDVPFSSSAPESKPATAPAIDGTAQWALEALSGLSDVNFDVTLPVSIAVVSALAGSSHTKEAPAKLPMAIPPISTGSRNNVSITEPSPKVPKVIQSPFESTQIMAEEARLKQQQATASELKLQAQPAPIVADPYQNLVATIPQSSAAVQAPSSASYAGTQPPMINTNSSHINFDHNAVMVGYKHGKQGLHQPGRSVSSLRDFLPQSSPVERASHELGHARRGEMATSADFGQPLSMQVLSASAPPALSLGSGYQIPWLPQSRPVLPPKADINSIDVPALTGRQQQPLNPRPLELDMNNPCLQFKHIGEAIRHWGQHTPEGNAFANLDGKGIECFSWDWAFTLGKAEMIAKAIHEKTQLRPGARVALVFRLSEILEFIAAFYGAILAGVVPVLVNQIQDFSEMVYIMTSAKVELALTTQFNHKALQQDLRKGAAWPSGVTWWQTDILEAWAPKNNQQERPPLVNNELAYIEYTKSAAGELKGVAISHQSLISQCQALYLSFKWRPSLFRDKHGNLQTDPLLESDSTVPYPKDRKKKAANPRPPGTVMTLLEPRQQSGLILGVIMGVLCGSFTVFMESSITAVSGLWAHSVAAYRANVAFADYSGLHKLLRNFRVNPQATVMPTKPDLRFLQTVYVDTQSNDPVLNREFSDEFLHPLGMIVRQDSWSTCSPVAGMDGSPSEPTSDLNSGMVRSDVGVIAFLSLPEHGGSVVGLRDTLNPPEGAEKIDFRRQFRKSTLPRPRRASESVAQESTLSGSGNLKSTEQRLQISGSDQALKADTVDSRSQTNIAKPSVSPLACGEYLLHRAALRSNRIAILATGEEAYKRRDEPGAILVGTFGYPLAESTVFIVDPETLALSLPDVVGEIWVSSPGMPVSFWGLPEHTQEVFNAKPYIITVENMFPTVYQPEGCENILRTGLLGALIDGRVVVFGSYWDRLQQDVADPMKTIGVQYEYHHCSDLKKTLFGKVAGIGEISIFECLVNKEYLPVVCIELSRDSRWNSQNLNTVAHQVGINVRHFLQEVNALRSYCVAVWDLNTLPRIFENGRRVVDHALCKKMFELGRIYKMLFFGTYTDDVLFNMPRGDDLDKGFWSRECCVKRQRRLGVPVRYVQYTSNMASMDAFDEKTGVFMGKFHSITDILIWRTIIQPDDIAFIELDSRGKEQRTIPFKKFNHKVTGYAMYLEKKYGLKAGDHVILWFGQDMDYITTLHACWALGLVPIPLALPDNPQAGTTHGATHGPFSGSHSTVGSLAGLGSIGSSFSAGTNPTQATNTGIPALSTKAMEDRRNGILTALLRILDEVKVKAILGNNVTDDFFKQKTTGQHLRACRASFTANYQQTPEAFSSPDIALPTFCNLSKATKSKHTLGALSGYAPRKEWLGPYYPAVYLIDPDAKSGSAASKKLMKFNHETLSNLCRNQKLQFRTLSDHAIVTCLNIFHGLGFIHGCLSGVYQGGPTVILQPMDYYANPVVWLEAVTRYKAQDVALTVPLLDQLLMRLDGTHGAPALGSVSLESVKNFMICGHGRIQREKIMTAIGRLGPLRLEPEAFNLVYSHPLNPMVASQVDRDAGPVRIHVSSRNLRYGLITPTTEGDDPTGIWLEDTGSATVCTSIAIVHPETFEVCASNQIGEIWVCSDSNANSFYSPPEAVKASQPQPFNACITGYDSRLRYIRTGDLGFLWNGQQQHVLQRQLSQTNNGQWAGSQTSLAATASFQLFVLGRMDESFQMRGILHFPADIEATVESAHANVATQGCVTFQTKQEKVVCVVKVQNQEPEVLLSMYIPLMHAILEQHQFLPDTIVLVGDNISTARRISDGLKPRENICNLYTAERLSILHLHHCHGSPLPPLTSGLLSLTSDRQPSSQTQPQPPAITTSQPPQPQSQQQQSITNAGSRFLAGANSIPGATANRVAPPHLHIPAFNNGLSNEASNYPAGSNRNSLYGSPLLVANLPLPPGTHNLLISHSPLVNSPASMPAGLGAQTGYQPQTQYHQGGYSSTGGHTPLPQQPMSAPSLGSNPFNTLGTAAALSAAATLPRPMSQQGFTTNSPYTGGAANGGSGSSSSSNSVAQGLFSEMAMYVNNSGPSPAGGSGAGPVNSGSSNSTDRSRGQHRYTQQPSQQHSTSQPQMAQRNVHPRQLQSQDARSLSSEELRMSDSRLAPSGAVKSVLKGMNAKWSEIRKAGLS